MHSQQTQPSERTHELRSEKVRSIVGQIPPALTRYGISIIGVTLLLLLLVAHYIPYRKHYTGEAILPKSLDALYSTTDSLEQNIRLRFDSNRPHGEIGGHTISFICEGASIRARIVSLSDRRDSQGLQDCRILLSNQDYQRLQDRTTDFDLIQERGSILSNLISSIGF